MYCTEMDTIGKKEARQTTRHKEKDDRDRSKGDSEDLIPDQLAC